MRNVVNVLAMHLNILITTKISNIKINSDTFRHNEGLSLIECSGKNDVKILYLYLLEIQIEIDK